MMRSFYNTAFAALLLLAGWSLHAQGGNLHNYEIRFPKDADANCATPNPDTILTEEIANCDLLAVSVQDQFFSASGNECYKIMRTYGVINWCEYDGQAPPIIVSRDEDCDGIPGNRHIWVLVRPNGVTYFDADNNQANNIPAANTRPSGCDGFANPAGHWINSSLKPAIASRGYWQYTQFIKVYDNTNPTISLAAYDPFCSYDSPTQADPVCHGPVSLQFSVSELCTPNDVTIKVFLDLFNDGAFPFDHNVRRNPNGSLSGSTQVFTIQGSYPNYTILSQGQGLPIGMHKFEIHAEDGCRNTAAINAIVQVRDCKAPAPICHNGLTISLMPVDINNDGQPDDGMAEVWATDFIASPIVDCTPPIRYSVRRPGQAPDINRLSLIYTCEDYDHSFGSNGTPHTVFVDAWDGAGNRDFCETYLLLQYSANVCPGPIVTANISGRLRSAGTGYGVQNFAVRLQDAAGQSLTLTNTAGYYQFTTLPVYQNYTVQPLSSWQMDCVTTYDVLLIQRHILGIQMLNGPYVLIACDVNRSGSITVLDLIVLQRRILAIDIPSEPLDFHRFIPADYVFPNPANPWQEPYPEHITFDSISPGDHPNQDFIVVWVGDASGCNTSPLDEVEERGAPVEIVLEDRLVQKGEVVALTLSSEQLTSMAGFQMALRFNPEALQWRGADFDGALAEENFGARFATEGVLMFSWLNPDQRSLNISNSQLVRLSFKALQSGRLSDWINLKPQSGFPNEAYDQTMAVRGITLRFEAHSSAAAAAFELYQNQPNPARKTTTIGFALPEAMPARLTITDLQGRVQWVQAIPESWGAGYHQVEVPTDKLPAGVWLYTLSAGSHTATRRMVVVR